MLGIANKPGKKEQEMNILQSNQKYLILSEDSRCDSPGHNSLYNQDSKKILATSLTQVTEVGGCSNRMEKAGHIKILEKVKGKQLKIKLLTTNHHCQIKKYMREEEENIDH